ncbi:MULTISPECIES: LysR substrate-binding domain-containing protein [Vibrio]|uniref:LysR family transcriptional regulator n=2 Tax=Vibrio TaxID=662 RepID=A0A7X4LPJ9_9VIBR|nr:MULTISPECIES: LysR substrate-binding domain-containing protein [Vibrio]MBF9001018.1 LysR family transcriptional regulator [Vibrio nitrifigilis]MZI95487.1 LysR family transcriptional regulator [Vibrio eleionomae]
MKSQISVRDNFPLPQDLNVLITVVRQESFAMAADELGVSPAYVSKRIQILEKTLNTRLLHRTTRRVVLTEDGQRVFNRAIRILDNMEELVDDLSQSKYVPRGELAICTSFGFGRAKVAPILSKLAKAYPQLDIRLDVGDKPVDLVKSGYDLEIRVGGHLPEHHIGKCLAKNLRMLCASPKYLAEHGEPETLDDLDQHSCLVLKEKNTMNGIWNLETLNGEKIAVRINSALSSNDGGIVRQWALHDQGIILRSYWDIAEDLAQGKLVQILPDYFQTADIWAIYPTRMTESAKLRVCIEFLQRGCQAFSYTADKADKD